MLFGQMQSLLRLYLLVVEGVDALASFLVHFSTLLCPIRDTRKELLVSLNRLLMVLLGRSIVEKCYSLDSNGGIRLLITKAI